MGKMYARCGKRQERHGGSSKRTQRKRGGDAEPQRRKEKRRKGTGLKTRHYRVYEQEREEHRQECLCHL